MRKYCMNLSLAVLPNFVETCTHNFIVLQSIYVYGIFKSLPKNYFPNVKKYFINVLYNINKERDINDVW